MSDTRLAITRSITQPAGGWRYTVPETGLLITAPTPLTLRSRVVAHMMANGIPVPEDVGPWFEDAMCRQMGLGEPFCGPAPTAPPEGLKKGNPVELANRFMRTMLEVLRNPVFVSREVAESRMDICKACPLATGVGACWGCNGLFQTVSRLLKGKAPRPDSGKEWCGACWCRIEAKVMIPNDVLDRAEKVRPDYAPGCWRNEAKS